MGEMRNAPPHASESNVGATRRVAPTNAADDEGRRGGGVARRNRVDNGRS